MTWETTMHDLDPEFEAALRDLGIDPATIRPGSPRFDAYPDPEEPSVPPTDRVAWAIRSWLIRWTALVHQPLIRRRAIREAHRLMRSGWELVVTVDPWDYGARDRPLEIRARLLGTQRAVVASGDLVLVAPGEAGYDRASRVWRDGALAASRSAWYVWLVPGTTWNAELVADARERWSRAIGTLV